MRLFKRKKILFVENSKPAQQAYLISKMEEMLVERYSSVKVRNNLMQFELPPFMRLGSNNGLSGKLLFTEDNDMIKVELELLNSFAAANAVLVSIIMIAVSFVAYFNSEEWIYFVIFPIGAIAYTLIQSGIFYLTSWYRYDNLITRISTIANVKK